MSRPVENLLARIIWALEAVELGDLDEARSVLRDLEAELSRVGQLNTGTKE